MRIAGLTLASVLFALGDAMAGGYALPHQTAKGVGASNALTAGVDDPSAVYYNPAALTEVNGNQLVGTLNYINVQSSVENSGSQSNNRSKHNFVPTLFGNFHIPNSDFTLGLGFYTPFGLSVKYDKNAFTRYAVVEAELSPYYINGAIGWRPNEYIALVAGVSYVGASATLSRAIYLDTVLGTPPGPLSDASGDLDARAKITGSSETATFNLGLLLAPENTTKVWTDLSRSSLPQFQGFWRKFSGFSDLRWNSIRYQGFQWEYGSTHGGQCRD